MTFAEVPRAVVERVNNVPKACREGSAAGGLRIFDSEVPDGIIRTTAMPSIDGHKIFTWCVGHMTDFHGGPGRLPTDDEVNDARVMLERLYPEVARTYENLVLPRAFGLPVRYFHDLPTSL